jgi:hypothetical protein
MSDYAYTIDLPDHKLGDRWPGVPVGGPVLIDNAQPANNLTRIRWHFVHRRTGEVFRMDTDADESPDAPIVISDDDTWEWNIPEIQDFLPRSGEWEWDAEFYVTGKANPLTLYKGTITVNGDITKTVL